MSYSPTMMRFAQADPIGYVDGPNLYLLETDNPINSLDPTGQTKIADLIAGDYFDCAINDKIARQAFEDRARSRLQSMQQAMGGGFQGTEGMTDYEGHVKADAAQIWARVNESVSPGVVTYAVNKALVQLGLPYSATIGTSEKASIDGAQGAKLWRETAFSRGGTILTISAGPKGSARGAPLGGGWNLKLYFDGVATYSLAVLPENSSIAHYSDAVKYKFGPKYINGDRAEEWLGRWGFNEIYNGSSLTPASLKIWTSGKHVDVSGYSGLPAATMPANLPNRED